MSWLHVCFYATGSIGLLLIHAYVRDQSYVTDTVYLLLIHGREYSVSKEKDYERRYDVEYEQEKAALLHCSAQHGQNFRSGHAEILQQDGYASGI